MRNFKLITASVLAILVAIVVVQNREPVATHLLFATVVMPHAILLFIASAAGFALGVLLTMSLKTKGKKVQSGAWKHALGLIADIFAPPRSGYLRRWQFPDFLLPEKKDTTRARTKSRPAKRTATKVSRIVDNDWPRRNAPPLRREVFAFDSGSIWPVSVPPWPSFIVFCGARLISSIFRSSAATIGWLFRSSAVSCISLVLLINAFFKIFVSIYPSRLTLTQPAAGCSGHRRHFAEA